MKNPPQNNRIPSSYFRMYGSMKQLILTDAWTAYSVSASHLGRSLHLHNRRNSPAHASISTGRTLRNTYSQIHSCNKPRKRLGYISEVPPSSPPRGKTGRRVAQPLQIQGNHAVRYLPEWGYRYGIYHQYLQPRVIVWKQEAQPDM